MQEGNEQSGGTLWTLKNVQTSTTCKWESEVLRPIGKDAWLVSSLVDPPASHLAIGDHYAALVPFRRPMNGNTKIVAATSEPNIANLSGGDAPSEAASVSTRLSDIKDDLEERLTSKLTSLIDGKMKDCDDRITHISKSLDEVKNEASSHAASTQRHLEEQSSAIQQQLCTNNNTIMQQMQAMFTKMQTELQASLTQDAQDQKRMKLT